ncbi:hypothetical protein M758_5G107600 [Ceratodon purpureus]|nr:hypothetical protein M758_5G107600 [Ceratodon purpureus]
MCPSLCGGTQYHIVLSTLSFFRGCTRMTFQVLPLRTSWEWTANQLVQTYPEHLS